MNAGYDTVSEKPTADVFFVPFVSPRGSYFWFSWTMRNISS